ncbi:virion structural protein [Pseudomonas phage Psa21]|uniref:Virion structural protein n=1 Tax=Pseudomonas phage Psa21 TaxID=2530023 RepID=A0A481W4W4_9CAUD|nr:virion structural protein [Pseudomonas phage Psa21]QBJ02708.1 virion structural protein [Pseudomonas phage Psa21]
MARKTGGNGKTYPMFEQTQEGIDPLTPIGGVINLLRKAVSEKGQSVNQPRVGINKQTMDRVSRQTSQDITDNDAIMQLNPDLELVETVMVGNILSPKDLGETELAWSVDPVLFDSEIARLLIDPVEEHFKRDYKINDRLDLVLREIMFRKGASIHIVLPENVLDHLVNGTRKVSMEAYSGFRKRMSQGEPLGFLGHPKDSNISLENWDVNNDGANKIAGDANLLVTDNFNILKSPVVGRRVREIRIADRLNRHRVSLEAEMEKETKNYNFTNADIEKLYQRNRNGTSEHAQVVTSPQFMDRKSVGHPLALLPPMEAVIPVFMQGRPHEHVGYFLLVDQNGYPVSKDSTRDFYGELQSSWKGGNNNDGNSEILRLTREAMGANGSKQDYEIDEVQKTYNSIIVNDLHNRLRNGEYDQELEIGLSEEIQRIMLFRSWESKCTQLVFIPAELCTYMAFNFNANGVGESLLARSKMIATMRSTLLMADTVGGMRNAVGRKKVNITLDPDDPDAEQTISNIQSGIMEQAHRGFPLAAPDPTQAMDHLIRSGFDFAINTNGADYAETKVEYDDYNTNQQAGNPDLQDRLRRMHISGMGVHPEKVDPMSSPDFATTATQNDLVFSRRVRAYQKAFTEYLQKFIRTYTHHSSILRQKMAKAIIKNRKMLSPEQKAQPIDDIIDDFISALEVSLPAPDNTQHERQAESYRAYSDLLDSTLEAYITPDLFPDEILGMSGVADKILNHVKAYFKRQWLTNNNVMPELGVLLEMDGDKPAFSLLDYMATAQSTMGRAFMEFIKHENDTKESFAKEFKALIEAGDAGGDFGGGGDDSGFGGDDAGGNGGDEFGGGDDLGGGDSFGDEPGSDTGDDMGLSEPTSNEPAPDEDSASDLTGLDNPVDSAAGDEEKDPDEDEEKPL